MATFGFGSNTAAATGFGAGTTAATGFGAPKPNFGFGATTSASAFGTTNTGTTGFSGFGTSGGGLTFGAAQPAVASSAGFGFGNTVPAAAAPAGGFSFGAAKPTATASGFGGFGSNTNTTTFGAGTNTGFGTGTNTGFGGAPGSTFGTGTTFGTGVTNTGFGAGTTGFGANTGTGFGAGPGTGFGTNTTFAGGAPGATGGFTGFGTGTTGAGLFGAPIKPAQNTLSFGLGTNAANNTFKGFGQPQQLQQQQQQQQQQSALCPNVALYMAVCAPAYFNDERDEVLKKWNQLQAVWGAGKGYYAAGMPPVELSPDNEFCRFKAVGYIKMPTFSPEEGLVELVIGKKDSIVREQQTALVAELCKMYGGAVQVCVEYVKPGPGDDKTRLCYYVQHRNANGETKRASTWEVYNHLKSDQHRQTVQNLCIESATPLVSLSESQLKEYLDKPPRGLDPIVWSQGKRNNPDSSKYLPVPLVGFRELQARFKAQETESQLLQGQLDRVAEDVCSVQERQSSLLDHLAECNRKQKQMAHRLLQLVVRQECTRKRGVPIDGVEEQLRIRLEAMQSQLHAPTQYMGKLNELMSQLSAQGNSSCPSEPTRLAEQTETDVKDFLAFQQDAISEVVALLKADMKTFQAMAKSS